MAGAVLIPSESGDRLPAEWTFASFDAPPLPRVVFGRGCRRRLGELARTLGASRALVVTDAGLVSAGHATAVRDILGSEIGEVRIFDRVKENPDTRSVNECLEVARDFRPDLLVALGGGSSMDTAKGCNFLLTNGGRMQDYWGVGRARFPMLPLLAVPTTAGTGSECQSAALIADAETHVKMACLDVKALARVAVLDPDLTVSMPVSVTACTGVDALTHALETAVTTRRNPLSFMYSQQAVQLLVVALPQVLRTPGDLDARGRMLLGAAWAGTAIELSMLGVAHGTANPLTARFGVVHGQAVGLMLPHAMRFNAEVPAVASVYAQIDANLAHAEGDWAGDPPSAARLILRVERLFDAARIPRSLIEAGVDPKAIPTLVDDAAKQWTLGFNPRAVTAVGLDLLYRAALVPRGNR